MERARSRDSIVVTSPQQDARSERLRVPCGRLRVSTTNRVIERKKRNLSARHYTQWRNENSPEAFGVCVPETRTMRVYPPLCIPPATWKFLTATEGGAPRVLCPRGRGGFVFSFRGTLFCFFTDLRGANFTCDVRTDGFFSPPF